MNTPSYRPPGIHPGWQFKIHPVLGVILIAAAAVVAMYGFASKNQPFLGFLRGLF